MYKLGVIKETKEPSDERVVITPELCEKVISLGFELYIQKSDSRCIKDESYVKVGANMVEDVSHCDILIGVKEVNKKELIPNKTYFFFSHTHKKQAYNRSLLQTMLKKKIRMIDYELLTDERGLRLVAFGKFAGMVGAHNALWTYNQRNPSFELKRMHLYENFKQAKEDYEKIKFPAIKIVLTGTGRVANGAAEVLSAMGIQKIDPNDFLNKSYDHIVFTQLACEDYVTRLDGKPYTDAHFFANPSLYKSTFKAYTHVADIMINGIFWHSASPVFFTAAEMRDSKFRIHTIADVSCDIAPKSSIPSTLFATTIDEPVFTYNCQSEKSVEAYSENGVDMMTIDNLPNEMPVDASGEFGKIFVEKILPEFTKETSSVLDKATICKNGKLTEPFEYLEDFVNETDKSI